MMCTRYGRLAVAGLACCVLFLAAATSRAAVERVRCIPWQGEITRPHTAIADQSAQLKCVVNTTNGDTVYYQWDFGDGTDSGDPQALSGSTRYNLSTTHTYTGATGKPFTAKLKVSDTDPPTPANTIIDNYLLRLEADSLDSEVNIAVDEGLWWLYTNSYSDGSMHTFDGSSFMAWRQGSYYASPTASTIQAFAINNHKINSAIFSNDSYVDPEDPYVDAVRKGMNWLVHGYYSSTTYPMLRDVSISENANGDDPEEGQANPNGYGIEVRDRFYNPAYEGGQIMDAIIASGMQPGDDTGRDFTNSNPDLSWTFGELLQDMADAYSAGQSDFAGGGGWGYSWDQGYDDNSASQWAAIGMIPAQKTPWNVVVPDWVKTRNEVWLNASYATFGGGIYGRFGYTSNTCLWSLNNGCQATTPSGMVEMVMNGFTTDQEDPRWDTGLLYVADNWTEWLTRLNGWSYGNQLYGMFAFVKAMRLSQTEQITTSDNMTFDWYTGNVLSGQGSPTGLGQHLIDIQAANGSWDGAWVSETLATAWAIIMLKPALFAASPYACFDISPNPGYPDPGQITFDPDCSDHFDSGKDITNLTLFEWDWDNDGQYDASSTTPSSVKHSFPCEVGGEEVCTFPISLRVTDDGDPALQSTMTLDLEISNPPHPPVADPDGPYLVSRCPDDSLTLDGSGSYDPNDPNVTPDQPGMGTDCIEVDPENGTVNCTPDTITAWDWDLGMEGYGDETGQTVMDVDLETYFDNGLNNIGLRVTDNTESAYPGSGQNNLTDEAFTSATVYDGCELCGWLVTAESVCQVVTLSWGQVTDAVSYEILRSVTSPDSNFLSQGTTTELAMTVGLMIDENSSPNYFRVLATKSDGSKCLSGPVEVVPQVDDCDSTKVGVAGGTGVRDYSMISFVVDPAPNPNDAPSVFGSVLGGSADPTKFRMAAYDPTIGDYIDYGPGLLIKPGAGYFFLPRNPVVLEVEGTPVPIDQTFAGDALLYNGATDDGWNQIGGPNDADYAWEDVQVWQGGVNRGTIGSLADANPYIDKRLWRWVDGEYYDDVNIVIRNQAYFARVRMAGVSLRYPVAAQLAGIFDSPAVFIARTSEGVKHWLNEWFFLTPAAVADPGETPPAPPGSLESGATAAGGAGGGCFITATADDSRRDGVLPAIIIVLTGATVIGVLLAARTTGKQ